MEGDKKTVYMVSTGSYSEYRIAAIYSDRAQAEKLKARLGEVCDADIVEMELDPDEPEARGDMATYRIALHLQPDTGGTSPYVRAYLNLNLVYPQPPVRHVDFLGRTSVHLAVLARDHEHATKIAADLLARYQIEGTLRGLIDHQEGKPLLKFHEAARESNT